MVIQASEIKYYLTGGAANSDPTASLGGAISSTEITSGSLHNVFDKVTGDESSAGDIEYRCIAVKNTNATLTLEAVKAYISANTALDDVSIGVETPSTGSVQTIQDESTAPSEISFSAPASRAAGITCTGEGDDAGEIAAGNWVGIWIKRDTAAETVAANNVTATIVVGGDTPA